MKIVTWNVNSIRSRQDRLLAWLTAHQPDVLCLQELKVEESLYPFEAIQALGYHSAVHCQKTYNGVAILSKLPPQDVRCGLDDGSEDTQSRFISANIDGVRVISVYVPNGGEPGSDKYAYKLAFYRRLKEYLTRHHRPDEPLAICGDFNVAPTELDVAKPGSWEGSVLYNPEMRAVLADLLSWGLEDAFRRHRPEPGLYSWWDYRMLAFPKNDGLRIDHVFATPVLASRDAFVDRNERKGDKPSDHVPLGVDFVWPVE